MKKVKLARICILLVPVIIVGVLVVFLFAWSVIPMTYNPMRRPAPMIRNHILRHTPIGMCMEDVIEVIENNEQWGTPIVNRNNGFLHPNGIVPGGWPVSEVTGVSIVGVQSVQTRPAIYNVILFHERALRIFWGFDENGELIKVHVHSSFAPRIAARTDWCKGSLHKAIDMSGYGSVPHLGAAIDKTQNRTLTCVVGNVANDISFV